MDFRPQASHQVHCLGKCTIVSATQAVNEPTTATNPNGVPRHSLHGYIIPRA